MSRSDQYIGLNERAQKLVEGPPRLSHQETIIRDFPDGRREEEVHPVYFDGIERSVWLVQDGAWAPDFLNLVEYRFEDGRIWQEHVQAEPWSSGPMYFIALKDVQSGKWIRESLWTAGEMLEADGYDPKQYGYAKLTLDQALDQTLGDLEGNKDN